MKLNNSFINILNMKLDLIQAPEVVANMERWVEDKAFGNYIVIANANDVLACRKDAAIKRAVNGSSFSVPDGISLVLAARLYGFPLKRRVYGPDLMLEFLKVSEKRRYSHFFYGATDDTLRKLIANLKDKFPKAKIAGSYSPPFRELTEKEEKETISMINEKAPDVLWVGLGCPKQQLWMYEHRQKLSIPVMVGTGAAFDFLAGTKPQAPKWMRDNGFEWLFRLVSEPRRLWKRYLVGNFLFLGLLFEELIRIRILSLLKNKKTKEI